MENKKNIFIIIGIIIVMIIIGILFIYTTKQNSKDNYLYFIDYFDDYIPGYNYDIYIYEDSKIIVKSQAGCSTLECLEGTYTPEIKTKTVTLKEENTKFLKEFLKEFMKDKKTKQISSSKINVYEKYVIDGIIHDEQNFESAIQISKNEGYSNVMKYYGLNDYRIYNFDGIIKVDKHDILCEEEVCEVIDSHIIHFNSKLETQIKDFIIRMFKGSNSNEIDLNELTLSRSDEDLVTALITNDETYMTYEMIMQDVSCNCIPNSVYFYEDGSFITRGMNYSIIEKGTYQGDLNLFISSLKDGLSDNEHWINYKVYLKDGKEYTISQTNDNVKMFLNNTKIKWID